MKKQTITNPTNGRPIKVVSWEINSRALLNRMKDSHNTGKTLSAKDISWLYLNDDQSVQHMETTEDGDSPNNNFALHIFEHALDWTIGTAILSFIRTIRQKQGKLIKHFTLHIDYKGRAYITYKTVEGNCTIVWSV